jgi:adenine-specific DNA-methyltransferase
MPTLDFKGKSFIYTHHLGVPYRELLVVPEKSCPAEGKQPDLDDNLILHGDNLDALKALLPRYAGKVDCIFIDPPYNTGNEGWCYNDAVNAPLMREWVKREAQPVDGEDLLRHDKWLCMMWPRLQLLKDLLSESGSLWMTLDDNEIHRARSLLDEIFGEDCCVGQLAWQKRTSRENRAPLSPSIDHLLLYSKSSPDMWKLVRNLIPTELDADESDGEESASSGTIPFSAQGYRKNQVYKIKTPTGLLLDPPKGRCWGATEPEFEKLKAAGRIYWPKGGNGRPRIIPLNGQHKGLVPNTLWLASEVGDTEGSKKRLMEIFSERDELGIHAPKPRELIERVVQISTTSESIILDSFAGSGTTAHAVIALNQKDGGNRRFILVQCDEWDKDERALVNLADSFTAERVRRVIRGYDYTGTQETELHPPENVTWTTFAKDKNRNEILERIEGIETLERGNYDKIEKKITDGVLTITGQKQVKEKMPGLGGSFTYVELGEAMDLERLLSETPGTLPSFPALARYLFFTSTGHTLPATAATPKPTAKAKGKGKAKTKSALEPVPTDNPVLIGETAVWRIYLHYRPDETWLRSPAAALTRTQVEAIAAANEGGGKQVLIFAAAKYINHRSLRELRVDFAQLPYALHRVQAE